MSARFDESLRTLTRADEKQLLVFACTCDRLEWQLAARRQRRRRQTTAFFWLHQAVRLGLVSLPQGIRHRRSTTGWGRALGWVSAGLNLFL